jgi:predicted  nucleic acid-binding Zn-ribbon protein
MTTATQPLAELKQQLAENQAKQADLDAEVFRNLVGLVDRNVPLDAIRVADDLGRIGKTISDLEAAVERLRSRRAWIEQAEPLAGLEVERAEVAEQFATLNANFECIKKTYEHDRVELQLRDQQIAQLRDRALDAKRQLRATATTAALMTLAQAESARDRVTSEIASNRNTLSNLVIALATIRTDLSYATGDAKKRLTAEIEAATERQLTANKRIIELEKQLPELVKIVRRAERDVYEQA